MHIAARNGLVTVTQALLEKGASVTVVDVDGYTPALACAPNAQVADCLSMIIHIMIDTVRNGRRSDSLTFPLPISEFSNHHHQRLIFICFVDFFVNIIGSRRRTGDSNLVPPRASYGEDNEESEDPESIRSSDSEFY